MPWLLRLLIARYGPRVARSMWARYQARRAVATGGASGGFGAAGSATGATTGAATRTRMPPRR